MNSPNGKVYLVGAGPGDPGLLTIRGLDCIRKADVLIYDYLASPALLEYASDAAERIYVGKKGGDHTLTQEEINALLLEKARAGNIVTRLKGGDPFIFGRGGEEAEVLVDARVAFEIVPGVTSAIAAPAYAGIPLTHRSHTATVAFVTGHEDPTKESSGIHWSSLARGIGTVVFLMGVKNLPHIVAQLMDHGKAADTPVALVRWGTTARQQTVSGTLENICRRVKEAGLKAPAIIVVGTVVSLREQLAWFERKPLLGRRILVTRARAQASDLVKRLTELGAECLEFPTIEVVPPESWTPLDRALDRLAEYHWLVFTSVNGVAYFFKRLFERGLDSRALGHLKTACIGPATAANLRQFGVNTDVLPESYRAESVVSAFANIAIEGCRVLLPRAAAARPVLPVELERMGAAVDEIAVYRTLAVTGDQNELIAELEAHAADLITFTSSSTVQNFKKLLPDHRFVELIANLKTASIGPITSDTARELGFRIDIEADAYTIDGLVDAIVEYFHPGTA